MCSRQVFHSLERKVDRPLRRAMLKGKAAKPLIFFEMPADKGLRNK
jgi:hypothetical protein